MDVTTIAGAVLIFALAVAGLLELWPAPRRWWRARRRRCIECGKPLTPEGECPVLVRRREFLATIGIHRDVA